MTAKSFAEITAVRHLWEISRLCLCDWMWHRERRPWWFELVKVSPRCRFHGGQATRPARRAA